MGPMRRWLGPTREAIWDIQTREWGCFLEPVSGPSMQKLSIQVEKPSGAAQLSSPVE